MNIKEWWSLLWLNWKVKAKSFIEEVKVVWLFYRNIPFLKVDFALRKHYLFRSAFTISKEFLQQRHADEVYAYGETPLTAWAHIAKECGLSAKDCVYELGCGRGRGCFWLRYIVGCKVVGIDYVPEFIETANEVKKEHKVSGIEFCLQDMCIADYSEASAIYLYGTCLDDASIETLIKRFLELPPGVKIITVSYPLTDYTDDSRISLIKTFSVCYPWGMADLFLHRVIS